MDNKRELNIELFDSYVNGFLSEEEKGAFEARIKSDKVFADDFRVFLFAVRGICLEAEQDNYELGHALKNISKKQLQTIIGKNRPRAVRLNLLRERIAWAASVAAVLLIGVFSVFQVNRIGNERLDNTLFAYNYQATPSKDGTEAVDFSNYSQNELKKYLKTLEKGYKAAATDQDKQVAGMNLAMAYLKLHDRDSAKTVLEEMIAQFSADVESEDFVAQCRQILKQL